MADIKKKTISYSQYSMWYKCPRQFKLSYIDNLKKFTGSVNTCFGTAIHEALQLYIKTLYTIGPKEADNLKLYDIFKAAFNKELNKEKNKVTYTEDEFTEFCFDGDDILKEFLKNSNRLKNFPTHDYEFIGTEFPLNAEIKNNINFVAYVDLILKNKKTGIYKIFDFKTSSTGWNVYKKQDPSKTSQLLLYKTFYSKIFNVPLDLIDIEFFILRRKLYEDTKYPQTRLQHFIPPNGKQSVIAAINDLVEFINECFTTTGEYRTDSDYFKNPGTGKKHCKYCIFYKTEYCDGKEDKEIKKIL